MKITDLYIYPIKSCRGIRLEKAQVTDKGLRDYQQQAIYDRQFMLVDEKGKFITQREYPNLATIGVEIKNNHLILTTSQGNLSNFELIPNDSEKQLKVKLWRDNTIAIDQGDEVAQWFQSALNLQKNYRLVKQSDAYIRPINRHYSTQSNQPVSFADGFPFLLTNTASLADLNRLLKQKYPQEKIEFPMNRFRPNIVIESDQPFIEDTWNKIAIAEVEFAVVKPCSRCIITTTDQQTGVRNELKEPLLSLSSFRKTKEGIMFGQNLIALNQDSISIGDRVTVTDS